MKEIEWDPFELPNLPIYKQNCQRMSWTTSGKE